MIASPPTPPRPTMVTVLGWIWIGLAAFSILTSVVGLAVVRLLGDMFPPGDLSRGAFLSLPGWAVVEWVFRHFEALAIAQAAVAAVILVAGVELLRLRRWARAFLEAVAWLGLAYMVGFGAWWGYAWSQFSSQLAGGASPGLPPAFMTGMAIGTSIAAVLFNAVPTGALIWFLRHPTTRAAVGGRRPGATPAPLA